VAAILGWLRLASTCASHSKRAIRAASAAKAGGRASTVAIQLSIDGAVDGAHAAFAELGDDAVVGDGFSRTHLGAISRIVPLSGRITRHSENGLDLNAARDRSPDTAFEEVDQIRNGSRLVIADPTLTENGQPVLLKNSTMLRPQGRNGDNTSSDFPEADLWPASIRCREHANLRPKPNGPLIRDYVRDGDFALTDRCPLRGDHPMILAAFAEPVLNIGKSGTSQTFY